jgi:tetratricopeptide (TPR) repeat protein
MKNTILKPLTIILLLAIIACQPSRKKVHEQIKQLEQEIFDTQSFTLDEAKAEALSKAYREYIDTYPDDSLSADYLFKLSEISGALGKHGESVELLEELIEKYPDYRKLPDALFLKGFILEDKLHNLNKAQRAYEELISKFPEHPYAENAKVIIENLGVPADSLVKRFESNQNTAGSQ